MVESYDSVQFHCPLKTCKNTFWTNVYEGGDMDESFCADHEDAYRDMMDERSPTDKRSEFYPRLRDTDKTRKLKAEVQAHLDDDDREFVLYEVL